MTLNGAPASKLGTTEQERPEEPGTATASRGVVSRLTRGAGPGVSMAWPAWSAWPSSSASGSSLSGW